MRRSNILVKSCDKLGDDEGLVLVVFLRVRSKGLQEQFCELVVVSFVKRKHDRLITLRHLQDNTNGLESSIVLSTDPTPLSDDLLATKEKRGNVCDESKQYVISESTEIERDSGTLSKKTSLLRSEGCLPLWI